MPLPILAPPTDNLYKFAAISSLALFIIGLIGPEIAHREELLHLHQVQATLQTLEAMSPEDRAKEPTVRRSLLADGARIVEQVKGELELYASYRFFGNILCVVSAFGVGVGFWLWYHRVQKYLDASLKAASAARPPET